MSARLVPSPTDIPAIKTISTCQLVVRKIYTLSATPNTAQPINYGDLLSVANAPSGSVCRIKKLLVQAFPPASAIDSSPLYLQYSSAGASDSAGDLDVFEDHGLTGQSMASIATIPNTLFQMQWQNGSNAIANVFSGAASTSVFVTAWIDVKFAINSGFLLGNHSQLLGSSSASNGVPKTVVVPSHSYGHLPLGNKNLSH